MNGDQENRFLQNSHKIHINPAHNFLGSTRIHVNKQKLAGLTFSFPEQNFSCDKIFYNPNFLNKASTNPPPSLSDRKILVNPRFVERKSDPEVKPVSVPRPENGQAELKSDKVLVNPKFLNMDIEKALPNISTVQQKHVLPSRSNKSTDSKFDLIASRKLTRVSQPKSLSQTKPAAEAPVKQCPVPKSRKNKYVFRRADRKAAKPVLGILRSQAFDRRSKRDSIRKLSLAFQVIGKRKLIRKSVIKSYISARRTLTNSQLQYVRRASVDYAKRRLTYKLSNLTAAHPVKTAIPSASSAPSASKLDKYNKRGCTSKSVITVQGVRYLRKSNGLKLKKLPSKTKTCRRARNKCLKRNLRKNNMPCTFFCRFGTCKRKENGTCHKVHDPKKVIVCIRHALKKCENQECTLSHELIPEKLPVCHYYLGLGCKIQDCPFPHMNIKPNAPLCRLFLQGYCGKGTKCSKMHLFSCPTFYETKLCVKGKKCPYPHQSRDELQRKSKPILALGLDSVKEPDVSLDDSLVSDEDEVIYVSDSDSDQESPKFSLL